MNDLASNPFPVARSTEWPWLALWFALLLPLALLFPPIPIDETRYLTAAWEMFNSGQWLVPTVNGAWYSDKSPLLFWLIASGWKLVGVHTWVARVEALVIALIMLLTLRRLAARLQLDTRGANAAMWLLAGCAGFAMFATAIMFDLLLAACILGALHALLDLDERRYARGIGWLGLMLGLGILAKGPVVLLHIAGAGLLAPLWSRSAREAQARWYLSLLAGILIGIGIALCWLLPAALYGGPTYWQPLIAKVTGRLHESFAHRRPFWWYFPLIPVLLLPWVLSLRAPFAAWRALPRGRTGVFLLCWWLPPLLAFCAISGKQIHYLAPLLPAWALSGAWLLQHRDGRLRPVLYAVLALLVAAGLLYLPWWAARAYGYPPQPSLMLFALVPFVIAIGVWRAWGFDARSFALAATALASVSLLVGALALQPALDVRPEAEFIATALLDGIPIAHIEWHNGLFGYTGRLRQPLPVITRAQVTAWCRAHPGGLLVAAGLLYLPWWAARSYGYAPQPMLMLFALVPFVIAIGVWRAWGFDARSFALAATALASVSLLAGALALQPALDVRPEAEFIATALHDGIPIAHIEWHNGLFGYTGRLRQPLPVITRAQVAAWCRAHPGGLLVASDKGDEPHGAKPAWSWPYFLSGSKRIGVWRARDVLAGN